MQLGAIFSQTEIEADPAAIAISPRPPRLWDTGTCWSLITCWARPPGLKWVRLTLRSTLCGPGLGGWTSTPRRSPAKRYPALYRATHLLDVLAVKVLATEKITDPVQYPVAQLVLAQER